MDILYNNMEYVEKLLYIYNNFPTYYAWGAFGSPANKKNRERYKVPDTVSASTFLFDCSGFAYKAIPWDWTGDKTKTYGGATYNLIPTDKPFPELGIDITEDFSTIQPGEVVYMTGHVGVYIGAGKVIECTAAWDNCVMITECTNVGINTGLKHKRKWLSHGKLPFIEYDLQTVGDVPVYVQAKIGDSLWKIAARHGLTLAQIKALNPNIKPPLFIIHIGEKVRIK